MSSTESIDNVFYPETDGEPLGETDLHMDWIEQLKQMLRDHFRNQNVYVSGNVLVYPEEGVPTNFFVPDVFVVKDCPPGRRRVFQTWEEGRVPNAVIEVTSRSPQRNDLVSKPPRYAEVGIAEYFLFDPEGDYLNPALQGHRLTGNGYRPIPANADGSLNSEELGLKLMLDNGDLQLIDSQTGERLLAEAEVRRKLEAENERLRRLLGETEN